MAILPRVLAAESSPPKAPEVVTAAMPAAPVAAMRPSKVPVPVILSVLIELVVTPVRADWVVPMSWTKCVVVSPGVADDAAQIWLRGAEADARTRRR